MVEPTVPLIELRRAARAYTILVCAMIAALGCFLFVPDSQDPNSNKERIHPAKIAAIALVYGAVINAARFAYEGGVKATIGGIFIPIYNIYLPFRVLKDTAAILKHSGLEVGPFGVSRKSWQKLEELRSQSLVHRMREEFRAYLDSAEFRAFSQKLAPGYKKATSSLESAYRYLCYAGQPVIACTLMRNVILEDKDEAAPALVMGTFDFTTAAWRNLMATVLEMSNPNASPEVVAAVSRITADDEYRAFRRRPLPVEIPASGQFFLFDELMRGSDLPDMHIEGKRETNPITVLLAMPQEDGPSAVMPLHISTAALKHMLAASKPPPLAVTSSVIIATRDA